MQTHALFIDDSGTKEYADDPADYNLNGRGKSRYFVFCGVLLSMSSAGVYGNEIVKLKKAVFGTDKVEIKSHWLRRPEKRLQKYLTPYGLTDADLLHFTDTYYRLLNDADLVLIASVVDKQHMQEAYGERAWYAPAVAYEYLIQRAQLALPNGESLAVIVDDMSGKTPKGNEYKFNLQRHHEILKQRGSQLMKMPLPCLSTITFANSQHNHMVQVADVCAYNVHRQFQHFGAEWETSGINNLPLYEHFEKINSKFRQDSSGRVQGYGIVKIPLINQVRWGLKK
ncbi:MAG: DUF3800 domain-containing protein [Acidobacteriota bacterium]|nr:DUF3800 domain-containing protein [Acidobacteriota bacterium]